MELAPWRYPKAHAGPSEFQESCLGSFVLVAFLALLDTLPLPFTTFSRDATYDITWIATGSAYRWCGAGPHRVRAYRAYRVSLESVSTSRDGHVVAHTRRDDCHIAALSRSPYCASRSWRFTPRHTPACTVSLSPQRFTPPTNRLRALVLGPQSTSSSVRFRWRLPSADWFPRFCGHSRIRRLV